MNLDSFKESVGSLWDNLAEGWKHLKYLEGGCPLGGWRAMKRQGPLSTGRPVDPAWTLH